MVSAHNSRKPRVDLRHGLLGFPQGKYEEAELVYRQAMAISETLFGTEHPSCFSDLFHLAAVLEKQVRVGTRSNKIWSISATKVGGDWRFGAVRLAHPQGQYEEAESLLRRAIAVVETNLGTGHPSYSSYLINLGELLIEQVSVEVCVRHCAKFAAQR